MKKKSLGEVVRGAIIAEGMGVLMQPRWNRVPASAKAKWNRIGRTVLAHAKKPV